MNKTIYRKIPIDVSINIRYLYKDKGVKGKKLLDRFPQYSRASIYRHAKKAIGGDAIFDKRKHNKGRPHKISERDKRNLIRQIAVLRRVEGSSFTAKRLCVAAGLCYNISDMTVRRCLYEHGYGYRRARKKGLLSQKDLALRLKFCRKVKRTFSEKLWEEGISFYLDGTGFTHMSNLYDQARCTKSMAWRKRNEGLSVECTTKESHEGSGGKVANFFVAIAYEKGVVLCEQYMGNLNGQMFADFIREHFKETFNKSVNPTGKLFLQDGDPSQNSKKSKTALDEVGSRQFSIPPRSPDLNPIESIFNVVKQKLRVDAFEKKIEIEKFTDFWKRVKDTLLNTPIHVIDKTIKSMNKRISLVSAC